MNKEERKKLHKALTHQYLKEQADGDNIANDMERQLERAVDKGYDKLCSQGISENFTSKTVEKVIVCHL
jgi:molecular chaperone GrpE (heat shock protein)